MTRLANARVDRAAQRRPDAVTDQSSVHDPVNDCGDAQKLELRL
jgi:hypothetical protein